MLTQVPLRSTRGYHYAARAALAKPGICFIHYGFNNLRFREIIAITDPENAALRRVLEKIGFPGAHYETFGGENTLVYPAVNSGNIYE